MCGMLIFRNVYVNCKSVVLSCPVVSKFIVLTLQHLIALATKLTSRVLNGFT